MEINLLFHVLKSFGKMSPWDYAMQIMMLLGGLGALLIGFRLLSENIEKLANTGLKKLFNKTSKNRFIGVGIGAAVTAIIQSSSASTVMIVGLVNAGIITLFQATSMIMGANIGTTITAQIVSLNSLDITGVLIILTFIGIFGAMLVKKEKLKTIFNALAGLGLVFLALDIMSSSMKVFRDLPEFTQALQVIENPFLLLLLGIGFTALIQSSSAVTTIIISMVAAGITIGNGGNDVLFLVLGSNIGTCITTLLSSIGASTNAKRASLIHLMFNLFGTISFMIVLLLWPSFMDNTFAKWFALPSTQIAMFHTFFNIIATLLFLPFINVFVKIATFVIKDKKEETHSTYLDERFLKTPAVALTQVTNETVRLGQLSMNTLSSSIDAFLDQDLSKEEDLRKTIVKIEKINQEILDYLIRVTASDPTSEEEKYISVLHRVLIDFGREAEIADNMLKYTSTRIQENLVFSEAVSKGINEVKEKLNRQFEIIQSLFENINNGVSLDNCIEILKKSDKIEDDIDNMRDQLINGHIRRLEEGKCSPRSNSIFISLVSNLERSGDHLSYIAHCLFEK